MWAFRVLLQLRWGWDWEVWGILCVGPELVMSLKGEGAPGVVTVARAW